MPENSSFMGSAAESIEGKTGSGSLVASSESDGWHHGRSVWGENTNISRVRSGVSPPRKRSLAHPESTQPYADKAPLFPTSRSSVGGQSFGTKSTKPLLDPTSMNFTSSRRIDPLNTTNFSSFGFNQDGPLRSEASLGSWHDAGSVHSPTDDRRSVANSEYLGPSSATPSRSGSLPPSRHGNEPFQLGQNVETYARYAQPGQRQTSSFSVANNRAFQERSGSIQSESLNLGHLSLEQDAVSGAMSHRPSMSINTFPPNFAPALNDATLARDPYDSQAFERPNGYAQSGTYTPDSFTNGNGHLGGPNSLFRPVQFDSHSAPNGTGVHQSPLHTHSHTPPIFDHLYPSRADNPFSLNSNNIALVNQRLAGHKIQQQDNRRNHLYQNQQVHPQQLQQLIAANHLQTNQLRGSYPYNQLPVSSPLSMPNNMHPIAQPLHGVIPIEAPRAPRDHSNPPDLATMSSCLYNFKNASKINKKFELKDIYGNVVEFSGDQHGSRFIQQKLEGANSDEKDKIFREIQENCLQLMQDVFGNYVIQKFFEHGDQTQKKFLANRMMGNILHLSNGMYGCRVVQKALEYVLVEQQAAMVKELEKDVLRCVRDCNGNHVIQKVIDKVPLEYIRKIIDAFRGQVGTLSVNTYGCRVIQRLLEKVPEPDRRFILTELHAEGSKLITDQYGNYVCQHIIEHGTPDDRAKAVGLVKQGLLTFSKHKFASNVVEKCLKFGNNEQRRELMLKLTDKNERGDNNLQTLIKDPYGNYVIQKCLETVNRRDYQEFVAVLKPELDKAKKVMSGKQIISVEKKMHRSDFNDGLDKITPTPHAVSSDIVTDVPPTPPLTSEAQSPQSSSLPSANVSTVDEPVHTSLPSKNFSAPINGIAIEAAENAS
ncbi:mRNA binding protein puf3 [Didymosphaeria variabile]|uniref:mRNA binding protein puf3 n=1 Tax=Didymosphaeria variabile TaxID=1932322 RepID=A0A9W9C7E0_9PLEO|nr:mRNA binding protein puf3 [Didymosphaeria variabile]KAJ4347805.1 mRNA binding protein puf3 [Didymosphaeria variabile]